MQARGKKRKSERLGWKKGNWFIQNFYGSSACQDPLTCIQQAMCFIYLCQPCASLYLCQPCASLSHCILFNAKAVPGVMSKRPLPTPPMELPTNIQMLRGFRSRMRKLNEARAQYAARAADEAASHDSAAGADEAAWHDSAAGADGAASHDSAAGTDEAAWHDSAAGAAWHDSAADDQADGAAWPEPEFPADWPATEFPYVAEPAHPPVDPAVAEAIQAVLEAVDRLCTALGV